MMAHYARGEGSTGRKDDRSKGGDEEENLLPALESFEVEDSEAFSTDPIRRRQAKKWRWLTGPSPPQRLSISPFFPTIQRLPIRFLDRNIPRTRQRAVAFAILVFFWFGAFVPTLWSSSRSMIDGDGRDVVNLDCVDTFWTRKDCGLDGVNCQPFSNVSLPFRCPPGCAGVKVLNPRAIGPLEVNYRPLIIGSDVYRGDSFICASALHAGIISDGGGCGSATLIGQRNSYVGAERNGLRSAPFHSYFPLSFTLSEDQTIACQQESRGTLLLTSILFTATLSLFATSPAWFFFPTLIGVSIHVALVSDPPEASFHATSTLPDHISTLAERLLPTIFCAIVLYQTCVKRTLLGLDAQFEKTLLWLGGFWFGSLSNYTSAWLPIQRLTPHDIEQQPGAKASLAVIIILICIIAAQQVYGFWLEGRLLRYLGIYGLFLLGILLCLAIPSVELRIHHYIIGLLLLPGTSLQTRPSLLYQGILLGLFVNGIARWGFASILQTLNSLREDAAFNSLLPAIKTSLISAASNITFTWDVPPAANMDGISMLVNDVEHLRRFFTSGGDQAFTWTRPPNLNLPEYFRFAFIRDGVTLDYTKTGTWFANGTWSIGP